VMLEGDICDLHWCCFVTDQVNLMKNLAELSQYDELLTRLKDIAAHVLSADNMRLFKSLCRD